MTEDEQAIVEVEGQVTRDDYVRFVTWTGFRLWAVLNWVLFLFFMFALTALLAGASSLPSVAALSLVAAVTVQLVLAWAYRSQAAKHYQTYKFLHEPIRYRFTNGGLSYTSSLTQTSVAWPAYHRAQEMKHAFYLYLGAVAASIIPKRFFESEEQMQRFRELLRANLPPEVCKI